MKKSCLPELVRIRLNTYHNLVPSLAHVSPLESYKCKDIELVAL